MEVSALKSPVASGLRGPSPLLRLQPDERLIALTRRGQHAAFETLFARYHARLLSFCRHMLGSREDAEDVLQEVFAAAFNAVLADERPINVRPWLYRIARNRSLNHLRRATAIGVDSMDVHFADNGLSTDAQVLRRESFRQLIGDVQRLPETQRTALLLREIDALSYEQIAQAMETTVPSVKSLLVRARISLAEAAEARRLTCEEVRHELGEVAEGLAKLTPPARRHLRDCDRCRSFRSLLKQNNHALAAVLPVGPLLLLKRLFLYKFGASAGAGHAAGAGGATTAGMGAAGGAGSGAGAAGAAGGLLTAGAGATAAGGTGALGGFVTAGAGAVATKAAATLAAAAIVAGAVAAEHTQHHAPPHHAAALASAAGAARARPVPQVVRSVPQPLTTAPAVAPPPPATHRARHRNEPARAKAHPSVPPAELAPVPKTAPPAPAADTPAADQPTGVQVTTETTALPPTPTPAEAPPATSTTPTTTEPPPSEPPVEEEPVVEPAPPGAGEAPGTITEAPPTGEVAEPPEASATTKPDPAEGR